MGNSVGVWDDHCVDTYIRFKDTYIYLHCVDIYRYTYLHPDIGVTITNHPISHKSVPSPRQPALRDVTLHWPGIVTCHAVTLSRPSL